MKHVFKFLTTIILSVFGLSKTPPVAAQAETLQKQQEVVVKEHKVHSFTKREWKKIKSRRRDTNKSRKQNYHD